MHDICVIEKTKLNLIEVKNKEKRLEDIFFGKIHNMTGVPLPLLKLKNSNYISTIIPQNIIRKITEVLGSSNERSVELFKLGARSIEDLSRDYNKYSLTRKEYVYCLYYQDLLCIIDEEEEKEWVKFFFEIIDKVECHIISSYINSRPDGNHSRMEVLICIMENCIIEMDGLLNSMLDSFPDGVDTDIYESSNYEENYSRIKCVIASPFLVRSRNKKIICDITVYSVKYHPYPLLREHKFEIENEGYSLRDTGLYDNEGKIVSFRKILGRDNPSDIGDIMDLIGIKSSFDVSSPGYTTRSDLICKGIPSPNTIETLPLHH